MKTENEIQDMADRAADQINTGTSKFRGMSYEEGVRTALEWVIGNMDEDNGNPLD